MVDKKKNRMCYKCNYGNTPENRDTCNYCGESFKDGDITITNVEDPLYRGVPIQKVNPNKMPKGWYDTPITKEFLTDIKECSNKKDSLPKIYSLGENAGSFYVVLTGSTGAGLQKFLDKHHKDLSIFNCYSDHFFEDDEDVKKNPIGTWGIGFEKRIKEKKKVVKK